jgi:hypothetical protein
MSNTNKLNIIKHITANQQFKTHCINPQQLNKFSKHNPTICILRKRTLIKISKYYGEKINNFLKNIPYDIPTYKYLNGKKIKVNLDDQTTYLFNERKSLSTKIDVTKIYMSNNEIDNLRNDINFLYKKHHESLCLYLYDINSILLLSNTIEHNQLNSMEY